MKETTKNSETQTKYRVVNFISGLRPIYTFEIQNNITCARSLIDGTLIHPQVEQDKNPESEDYYGDEMVSVYWQGDISRKTEVNCIYMATIAVAKWVEFNSIPSQKLNISNYEHLYNHFMVKTGEALTIEPGEVNKAKDIIDFIAKEAFKEGMSQAIKKQIGL